MKNAIILHGAPEREYYYDPTLPSESNAHWLPWLQKELIIRDIYARTPEMPLSFEPKWNVWSREIDRYDITSETMLVGHSCGGGFWLKYLSQHPELTVGRVVLVGPWLDPNKSLEEDFFDGELDSGLAARTQGLVIFRSTDDSDSVHESIEKILVKVGGVKVRDFEGYGHFTFEDTPGSKFPELLEELLRD